MTGLQKTNGRGQFHNLKNKKGTLATAWKLLSDQ